MRFSVMVILALCASGSSFAADFAPELLKLSAPTAIQYDFDGSNLNVPVTVSGKPAAVVFCVYTKGKAESIRKVQNGYLGWHYVNKIDTSIYISPIVQLNPGSNQIVWSGKDENNTIVAAGDYTYYIWGYGNTSPKMMATSSMTLGGGGSYQAKIQETGPDGAALVNPVIYSAGGRQKWIIGADPMDETLLETTSYNLGSGFSNAPAVAFQPGDFTKFFLRVGNSSTKIQGVRKMVWVPNGVSVTDLEWGEEGIASWSGPQSGSIHGGPEILGDYIFATDNWYQINEPGSNLYYISLDDGVIEQKRDMSNWWVRPDELSKGGMLNSGPGGVMGRGNFLFFNSHSSCIKQLVSPLAADDEDFVVWTNQNGDYILDYNFEPDSKQPWFCNGFVSPYTYQLSPDANLFSITSAYDLGAVSFGLLAPDGTGVDYLAYSGETAEWKIYNIFVDSGSAYDGIYCDNQSFSSAKYPVSSADRVKGVYFIGHDSIKGSISNQIAVKEKAPAAFTVSQNAPNPFNPTTTINFTLAKAGKTTVEIFNAAGQRVDTLIDANLSAGHHSVTWNAVHVSAGVYFYTVRNGEFTKTMKMTLLK